MGNKIIVADDSETIQKVVEITFQEKPHEVTPFSNFEDLWEFLKNSTQPHLILYDFTLDPDRDGYQIARTLKKKYPKNKIILMYGPFDKIDQNELKHSDVEGHIFKPFESNKLIRLCEEVMELEDDDLPEPEAEGRVEVKADEDLEFITDKNEEISDELSFKESEEEEEDQIEDGWELNEVTSENLEAETEAEAEAEAEEQNIEMGQDKHEVELPESHETPDMVVTHHHEDAPDLTLEEIHLSSTTPQPLTTPSPEVESFWAVDQFDKGDQAPEVKPNLQSAHPLDRKTVEEVVERYLPEVLEAQVREKAKEVIEKVAWEIIPELAENLIKKELREIAAPLIEKQGPS